MPKPFWTGLAIGVIAISGLWLGEYAVRKSFDENPTWLHKTNRVTLETFSETWQKAYETGDFETLAELYHPDAWHMMENRAALKSRIAIISNLKASRKSALYSYVKYEEEDLHVDVGYAFKVVKWQLVRPQDEGGLAQLSGRSIVILKESKDNGWQIWRVMDNQSPDTKYVTSL